MYARSLLVSIARRKEISVLIITIIIALTFYGIQPKFLSIININVLLTITPELGIPALGVTLLMIAGEFDLSIGSVFGFAPLLIVVLTQQGADPLVSIAAGLIVAGLVGLLQGAITVKTRIPSFITTLAGLEIWRAVALIITGGQPFSFSVPSGLRDGLTGDLAPLLNVQMLWFFALAVILTLLLTRSKFGNWIYGTGGNVEAARAMGINTHVVKLACFTISSVLAAFGGIIQSVRLTQATPNQGSGLELDAIAAAVIGGTSLFGGSGTIIGSLVAEYLTRIIGNGLVIIRAPSYYFTLFIGIVLVIAVVANLYIQRRIRGIRAG